ncbi:hypothetical protein [Streptomyces sp. NPDC090445]|uniref:hypothetical protein n=1 Tax=Streptomyces sp. NPDC090445 TaxID=3365963 RepID=UPI0037F6800C
MLTRKSAATALVGATLLACAACGPQPGKATTASASASTSASPSPTATADVLAGQDPAAVLRRAYEETQRAGIKEASVHTTVDERQMQAELTVGSDGSCSGSVTTILAGSAELYLRDGVLLIKGDTGFLENHFEDRSADAAKRAVARAAGQWAELPADEPSTARLTGLCTEGGAPAKAYSLDRTDIRRGADTSSSGRPVAVFTSTDAQGARITDHVLLSGAAPSLTQRYREAGKAHDRVWYKVLHDKPYNRLPTPAASVKV